MPVPEHHLHQLRSGGLDAVERAEQRGEPVPADSQRVVRLGGRLLLSKTHGAILRHGGRPGDGFTAGH
ncbi:MAG TPA: hypothetical protein VGJ63_09070 [Micromonosporaceae bacterium]